MRTCTRGLQATGEAPPTKLAQARAVAPQAELLRSAKGNFNEGLLLHVVGLRRTCRRTCCCRALHREYRASARDALQPLDYEPQRAHVGRLFLHPDNLCGICMALQLGHEFLFFQAEDGIRDLTVTGVQTCALPI